MVSLLITVDYSQVSASTRVLPAVQPVEGRLSVEAVDERAFYSVTPRPYHLLPVYHNTPFLEADFVQ
jgi:hypothetical protein